MGAAAPFARWCRSSLLVRRSLTARDETRRGQRQQSRLGSKILLPPPTTNTERVWKEIIRIEKLKKDYKYFFEHTNTGDREALAGLYDSV